MPLVKLEKEYPIKDVEVGDWFNCPQNVVCSYLRDGIVSLLEEEATDQNDDENEDDQDQWEREAELHLEDLAEAETEVSGASLKKILNEYPDYDDDDEDPDYDY